LRLFLKYEFVTVVYNNSKDTHDFLESLSSMHCNGDVSCVIIDNSDVDNIINEIKKLELIFPFVKVLNSGENLGYFGAFNYYFKNSHLFDGDIVLLCNNDLIFCNDFLLNFEKSTYPENVFVVCPDVITLDGVHQNPHVLKPRTKIQRIKLDLYFTHYYVACILIFIKKISGLNSKKSKVHSYSNPGYLHMGIGACYVLLPTFLDKFKYLNFPHFLYGEEAYLTEQVHNAGGALYYDPALKVQHKESATLSKLPKRKTYQFGRDGYWSYRKFY
jgi:GT2 family glycosyltransferase